ncbi:MAG: FecR domain-containing protein [Imperialibacter sp.]|uniref:FecR family protein n=1 Tax=Imperialibacter sp. TaxID=2038411 RepID=UPI0032EFF59D
MSKQSPHIITNELLAKYFASETSDEESAAVMMWVAESAANEEAFVQQKMLWEDLGAVMLDEAPASTPFDVDTAWVNVKTAKNNAVGKQKKSEGRNPWIMRIAASLVLLGGITYFLRIYFTDVQMMEVASASEIINVDLQDGSYITLNEESIIQYPEEFAANSREMSLKGEAFFEVEPDLERPFVIHAGPATIKVLGTSFNVKSSVMEDTVSVFVATGRVSFSVGTQEVILTPGEKATYTAKSGLLASTGGSTSTGIDQFWRTRRLSFAGHSLPDVIDAIEEAYFVDIELENEQMANCRLSVNFENDSLNNILDVIALTLDLKVSKSGNVILLKGTGCPEN